MTQLDLHDDVAAKSPAIEADAAVELEAMLGEAVALCLGLPLSCSHGIARNLVKVLRIRHGASEVYIPAPDRKARDASIKAELRTGNAADLAARHNISVSSVYKIARKRTA
jgi:hypothetical protein